MHLPQVSRDTASFSSIVSAVFCVYASAKALRIGKLLYPVFAQMREAVGTPRYSPLQMQWRSLHNSRMWFSIYVIVAFTAAGVLLLSCHRLMDKSD